MIKEAFIQWGLCLMEKIRSSFTPHRMKMERGKYLQNAWVDVNSDALTNEKFSVAWETISHDIAEEEGEKEVLREMVRTRFTRKVFNARNNTTFNWYKRKALEGDRVNFRSTLSVKSIKKTNTTLTDDDITRVFNDLEDAVMSGIPSIPIRRELPFENNVEEEPKRKRQKTTINSFIANKLDI